ncbi:hypothetical protein O9993_16700 [Vibrio lentus]|nr:hypothetical protein [Vibrio lentus]
MKSIVRSKDKQLVFALFLLIVETRFSTRPTTKPWCSFFRLTNIELNSPCCVSNTTRIPLVSGLQPEAFLASDFD